MSMVVEVNMDDGRAFIHSSRVIIHAEVTSTFHLLNQLGPTEGLLVSILFNRLNLKGSHCNKCAIMIHLGDKKVIFNSILG
jgi:hypothetical protein